MREGMVLGQFLPGNSLIHRLDPRTKLIFTVFTGIAVTLSDSWFELFSIAILVITVIYSSKISLLLIVKAWAIIWFFLAFLLVFQVMFTPGEAIYEYGFFRVTREGLNLGGQLFIRLVLIMALATTFTFTTSPVNIAGAIEVIFAPLKKLKIPVHELAMMMTIAIRFLPTMHREANKIIAAQRSRGATLDYKGITKIYKIVIPVIVPLFVGVFQRAEDLATAMEIRCYRGGEGRSRYKEFNYTLRDYVAITISCLILLFAGLM